MIDETMRGMRAIWFDAEKNPPPAMQTVLLCIKGKVLPGWNESTQPEEDPSYCTWEGEGFGAEGVTHWMPLPEPPKKKNQNEAPAPCREDQAQMLLLWKRFLLVR